MEEEKEQKKTVNSDGSGNESEGNGADQSKGAKAEQKSDEKGEHKTKKISYAEYEELKTLAEERDEYLKRLKRAVANTMSLQKRLERVKENADTEALRQLGRKIVPLADGLVRARENAENTDGAEKIAEGIKMTEKEFYNILEELDIQPIKAQGQSFDPSYHEAVMQEPREDCEPETVVRVLKKGFMLNESLLRPAQVVVSVAPSEESDEKEGDSQE